MSTPQTQPDEPLPVDETIKVIEYKNVYKNGKWWCAVVLADSFGHKKIMVYLWQWSEILTKQDGKLVKTGKFKWKRKQKMGINFRKNWDTMKPIIEDYLNKAGF